MAEQGEAPEKMARASDVKRIIRRIIRKHPPHEEMSLNIYPMMDMMTILLVFLIMSFASSSANVVQSSELQIPYSVAEIEPADALSIQISTSQVVVENKRIISLRNGLVDPSQKQGGGNGFLISPLLAEMQQHRDRLKFIAARNAQRPFSGTVQIIADKRTPYRTLIEIIYTCGQAEFKNMKFVVLRGGGGTKNAN